MTCRACGRPGSHEVRMVQPPRQTYPTIDPPPLYVDIEVFSVKPLCRRCFDEALHSLDFLVRRHVVFQCRTCHRWHDYPGYRAYKLTMEIVDINKSHYDPTNYALDVRDIFPVCKECFMEFYNSPRDFQLRYNL